MRYLLPFPLLLAACTPPSSVTTVDFDRGDIIIGIPPTAQFGGSSARLTPADVLTCTPFADKPAQSYVVPGLFAQVSTVFGTSAGPTMGNANSQIGQIRTFPYRTPPRQLVAVLNAATAPDACITANPSP